MQILANLMNSLINKIRHGKLCLNYAKSDQARLKSSCEE